MTNAMTTGKVLLSGIGITVAAFAGFFGALQLKDALDHRHDGDAVMQALSRENIHSVSDPTVPAAPFDFRAASKKVIPSVVSVDRLQRVQRYMFDDEGEVQATGTGSGVVITKDGIIVTNNHVVADATEVKVRTPDHKTFNAKVLGRDPRSDLAVLKIDAHNLTPVELGDSNDLGVGQWVMAVGNPLGFDNTVSVGVVSSLKRNLPVEGGLLLNAIQTDAAINPGNSGGALTNATGQLIGINSAIASNTGQSVGIGFAIPVDRVKEVVDDIMKLGYTRYAGLGINFNPRFGDGFLQDPQVVDYLSQVTGSSDIPEHGLLVKSPPRSGVPSVQPNGAAAKAGIREWDILLAIDGTPVVDMVTMNEILTPKKPGDTVTIKYWSKGQTKSAKVTLQELREQV